MMDRISLCEAKRNEIDPFLKRMMTGNEKWDTYDNIVRKRSWSKRVEASQTVAKPGLTSRKVLDKIEKIDRDDNDKNAWKLSCVVFGPHSVRARASRQKPDAACHGRGVRGRSNITMKTCYLVISLLLLFSASDCVLSASVRTCIMFFLWFRIIEKYHSVEFSTKRRHPSAVDASLKNTLLTTFPQQGRKLIQHDSILFAAEKETVKESTNRSLLKKEVVRILPWMLAVVDEMHEKQNCRVEETMRVQAVEAQSRSIWGVEFRSHAVAVQLSGLLAVTCSFYDGHK
ncbi:mariner transposase [Trichonephila clavipes]|nr:mariner transposase [Trichonephila clavipes]